MATLTSSGIKFAVGDELNSKRQIFAPNTAWVFYQAAAPTGWTKVITEDNKALRVVSGVGGASGGTVAFTTVMSSFVIGGTLNSSDATGNTQLDGTQIPGHDHINSGVGLADNPANFNPDGSFTGWSGGDVARSAGWTRNSPATGATGTSPVGDSHSHPYSGTGTVSDQTVNIDVQYMDVIICTFDG
jgi:hypothetical protein